MLDRYDINRDSTLIAVSSTGRSHNICVAAQRARDAGAYVMTFTGFDPDNPLRKLGQTNYWVPSANYGIVECAHMILLHSIVNPGDV
jgi:D-sedoheptulose 7-phosphate isomerase